MPIRSLPFIAALCLWSAAAVAQQHHHMEARYNQVELQAEVSREVQNDLMTATMFAELNDANAGQLAGALNRIGNEALKVAAELKAVKTRTGINQTYPVYDRNNKLTGWRGRTEVRLESKDFGAMASLIAKLQSNMQLGGVAFAVSPELRRQTQNELMTEVVGAFRERAEVLKKALGGTSYKLRNLSVTSAGMAPAPRYAMARQMAADAAAAPPPAFEGGTSTVQVMATGTIEVE